MASVNSWDLPKARHGDLHGSCEANGAHICPHAPAGERYGKWLCAEHIVRLTDCIRRYTEAGGSRWLRMAARLLQLPASELDEKIGRATEAATD